MSDAIGLRLDGISLTYVYVTGEPNENDFFEGIGEGVAVSACVVLGGNLSGYLTWLVELIRSLRG